MSWLSKKLAKMRGGHPEECAATVRSIFANGGIPNVAELSEQFLLAENATKEIILTEQASRFSEMLLHDYQNGNFTKANWTSHAGKLGIATEDRDRIVTAFAIKTLGPIIAEMTADDMLDPDEMTRLAVELAKLEGVSLTDQTWGEVAKAQNLWRAIYGELPVADAPVLLKANEYCVHVVHAKASEVREKTTRVNYSGVSARVPLGNGLSYRVGSVAVDRDTEQYEHSFGVGALCITNKRLLWVSPQKSLSITLNNIVRFDDYSNALCVYKGTGKPVMFRWLEDDRASTLLACRVIRDLR